jgi:predicted ATPase/DNA-binding SARP family transcriptional activator
VQVGVLGPLEVREADRVVAVPGARLQQLLTSLALDPGRWVSPGALAEAVWADDQPADPANSLQSLVSRLRRVLGRPELVEQSAAGYRLAVAPDAVDALRFTRLVGEGHRLLGADDPAAEAVLDQALALWRGDPLPGDDSPEAAGRRNALTELRVEAQRDRALLCIRAGRAAEALPVLEELAAAHPLREDVAGVLVEALASASRPAEALAAYERLRATLAETLGTDPSPALRARHLELLRAADRPAEVPSNLRAAVTSFVGRDDDVRRVRERLTAHRLVTVVGAGGSGKTRLAGEVAGQLARSASAAVPDGVWLIELAPVSEPTAVAQAVLDGLGAWEIALPDPVADYQRRPARERLLDRLAGQTCLLVVDNCEHLIDAVAEVVADVLGRCPGVRVLATSREPLAIEGETLYPLGPLAVPAEEATAAEAAANPAVRLLLDRARAVDPDVGPDDAMVEIVRRLDGLPLAIELAAARLRVLSPRELAERLADRFRLLTGGRRTATPRHRTLRAVVEWSWDLLTPSEREVADHFSVFASGATEPAVAAVTPSWRAGAATEPLADVLHALVDKSLLIAVRTAEGTRFRMLETLREFGAERLAERGLMTAARDAHARWFAELVRSCDAQLRGPEQLTAVRLLDEERDDVLAALRYLGDTGDAAAAIDLVVHLGWYWMLRENGQDAVRWTTFALAVPGAAEEPRAALAEALQAMLGFALGAETADAAAVREAFVACASRLAAVPDPHPAAKVVRPLLLFMGERRQEADVALAELAHDADPWVAAAGRLVRLLYAENEGDVALMRREGDAALRQWEALGDRWAIAALLSSRGQVRTMDGDLLGAAEDFERAQEYIREFGGTSDSVLVSMRLVDLRLRAGDTAGARRHLAAMRAQAGSGSGQAFRAILVQVAEGAVALVEGDDAALAGVYAELRRQLATLEPPTVLDAHSGAIGHAVAASFGVRLGRLDEAAQQVRQGDAQALLTHDRPILAAVGTSVAHWAGARGHGREAAVALGAASRLRGTEDPTNPMLAQVVDGLRATLGDEYDVAYAEGLALDPAAATAYIDPQAVRAAAAG